MSIETAAIDAARSSTKLEEGVERRRVSVLILHATWLGTVRVGRKGLHDPVQLAGVTER
ncbi:MAG: hypothetical protein ACRDZR_07270 [Acidimicrobiales bacterium]